MIEIAELLLYGLILLIWVTQMLPETSVIVILLFFVMVNLVDLRYRLAFRFEHGKNSIFL